MARRPVPGTTLDDPVGEDYLPNLGRSLHDINEYLADQNAFDIFDGLLKEVLIKQPADPLQHMIACLEKSYPSGTLKVVMSGAPGVGRGVFSKRLADYFGLQHIRCSDLLQENEVDVRSVALADDEKATQLVLERIKEANNQMQGWVLDGFPRTRVQTTRLKENTIVPTHVLVLKEDEQKILERNRYISEGTIEGEYIDTQVLEQKLRLYTCHAPSTLECWQHLTKVIDVSSGTDSVWAEMVHTVRKLPRSGGPRPPSRIVILGPRGSGAREHASRLAARLGAVFVDGAACEGHGGDIGSSPQPMPRKKKVDCRRDGGQRPADSGMDLLNLQALIAEDPLGVVGVRLRQPDCTKFGYVACGFPSSEGMAQILAEDPYLAPTRVLSLAISAETCVARLRNVAVDPVTGKVWSSSNPRSEQVRQRLMRDPENQPQAVLAAHAEHSMCHPGILRALSSSGPDGRCTELPADGPAEDVHREVVEMAERPLPLPLPAGGA